MNNFSSIISGLFLLLFAFSGLSQEIPKLEAENSNLGLKNLHIKVEVVGNIATTTYDMLFYNELNRQLEGELLFPLGEDMQVSRFALDINGNLREAMVVEKELARVAFENTVRQRIDPALLEQSAGNNYKARVYPIPANGTKRVVLAYEQELLLHNNAHFYNLPLNFTEELEEFSLEMVVYEQTVEPTMEKGDLANFHFDVWKKNYIGKITQKNFIPNQSLRIKIPVEVEKEKLLTSGNFFYFYKTLSPEYRKKEKPEEIAILWDVSYSMKDRNLKKEFQLLNKYFEHIENVQVNLLIFSNELVDEGKFNISNGNWQELKKSLSEVTYDGGTAYSSIPISKVKGEEILFFTDGLDNLGDLPAVLKKPVYVVNSMVKSNHSKLSQISTASGGNYINLNNLNVENAAKLLQNEVYRFLGVTTNNAAVEIYPQKPMPVTNDFSVSGKNFNVEDRFVLHFGFGNKVTQKVEVVLKQSEGQNEKLEKIWAQKKLKHLLVHQKDEKGLIINHSTKHQIISPYTSLIVLDRVEDYVQYEITPPAELLKGYKHLLALKKRNNTSKKELFLQKKKALEHSYKNLADWWERKFDARRDWRRRNLSSPSSGTVNPEIPEGTITGLVTNSDGYPLPGVNVLIMGTSNETRTDFDGKFELNVEEGDEIQLSYIGFQTQIITIGRNNSLMIVLQEDTEALEEIVVTRGINAEIQVVEDNAEDVQVPVPGPVQEVVEGDLREKESNSAPIVNSPLYIINGVVVEGNPNIDPAEIEEKYLINANRATAIYGAKAAAGVVVINTKEGLINKREQIQAFEQMVEEKIALRAEIPNSPYMDELRKAKSIEEAYNIYLQLRSRYSNSPSFFIDVADFFEKKNKEDFAIKILTNLAEMDIDNYELLKALAYKLEFFKKYEKAAFIYQKILELRPEDIQSYRDLALAYQSSGEYQKALDLFYRIVNAELYEKDGRGRFTGIEAIAFVEMNNLINKYGEQLNLNAIDRKYIKNIAVDLRVVIDWNHNDTDMDLWVIDPYAEKCFYQHPTTKIGGRISDDMTEGFGPEEFLLKKAAKGAYEVLVNYYGSSAQKISGPTFLKVTIFKNYGTENEKKETAVYRLENQKDEIEVAKITI